MKIIKGKTILHNTITDYVFLAGAVDEKTQLSEKSHKHIVPLGELSTAINEEYNPMPEREDPNDNFLEELTTLINRYSKENSSNTPDYMLAEYLNGCLGVFNKTLMKRSKWYGFVDRIGYKMATETKELK